MEDVMYDSGLDMDMSDMQFPSDLGSSDESNEDDFETKENHKINGLKKRNP